MDGYISTEELKATLELTNTNFADEDVPRAIKAASRGIDRACRRRFYADEVDPSNPDANFRVYTARSYSLVWIDDLIDLVSVKIDADGDGTYETTWTLGTHFTLNPSNAAADSMPYEFIQAKRSRGYRLPCGIEDGVKVTGTFGWSAVPDEVIQATTILASKLLLRARQAPFGIITVGADVGAVARLARTDPDVAGLLAGLIRKKPF